MASFLANFDLEKNLFCRFFNSLCFHGVPGQLPINKDRSFLKWKRFVNPATSIPTGTGSCPGYNQGTRPANWDDTQNVGLFEGGGTYGTGVYRPVINCRVRGNSRKYCPVCYTHMKDINHSKTEHTFLNCHTGDFNGDGKDD